MTAHRDLKQLIRDRQRKTGESYTAARAHVMRERARLLGLAADAPPGERASPARVEAAVLKINRQSARVRILGEAGQVTFRSAGVWRLVPGHIATLAIGRRWTWRDDDYVTGAVESARIDVVTLGLDRLRLEGGELDDVAARSEPYRRPDPYAPVWRKLTAKPRPAYEFDGIAWGALPGRPPGRNPTCDAAELAEAGDVAGARGILMEVLAEDLRCLDAHAHLGNWIFERSPQQAMLHYEIGVRIGELSLPAGFDGLLIWGQLYNRPFLRCLHGYGLCLWRLGRPAEARQVFERILSFNPEDNQGVRFCWDDVGRGKTWQETQKAGDAEHSAWDRSLLH